MERETILIIDDDHDTIELLELYLSAMNYQTLAACDYNTGLQLALDHHPDLIFLDLEIRITGGLEMLKELNRRECISPVILMTAISSEKITGEVFRLGVREYLNKPFTGEVVRQVTDHALRETRLAREREILQRNLNIDEENGELL